LINARLINACGIPGLHGAGVCDGLPVRLFWVRGELLAVDRNSERTDFCESGRARCKALTLVPCRWDPLSTDSPGFLALSELGLHARLVRNCLPGWTSPWERMWLREFPRTRARLEFKGEAGLRMTRS
jgi:hypothetical protein